MVKRLSPLTKIVTDGLKNGIFDLPNSDNVFPYIEKDVYEEIYNGRKYIVRKNLETKQFIFYVQQFADNSNANYVEIELDNIPQKVRNHILRELI